MIACTNLPTCKLDIVTFIELLLTNVHCLFVCFHFVWQVAPKMVYCGTFGTLKFVLKRFGVEYTFVDGSDISQYREAVKPNTKVLVTSWKIIADYECNINGCKYY